MSEAATTAPLQAPQPARAAPGPALPERRHYEASGARKTVFSFVFLLLAPFVASLPIMLYQRVAAGVWFDTWGLIVIAVGFFAIMLLVLFELMFSLRAEVDLGDHTVRFTLPNRGGGLLPRFSYTTRDIPYTDIRAVETRYECYGGSIAPVMLKGARIITAGDAAKPGESITLGYVNENNVDPTFPFPVIAEQIARRAGLEVIHRGHVKRRIRNKLLGIKAGETETTPLPDTAITALNRRHREFVLAVLAVVVVLLGLGITADVMTSSLDRGERAMDQVTRR